MTDRPKEIRIDDDPGPQIVDLVSRVEAEMYPRLDAAPLSDRDVLAVSEATTKAAIRGYKLGQAHCEQAIRRGLNEAGLGGVTVFMDNTLVEEPDEWAERYGGQDES